MSGVGLVVAMAATARAGEARELAAREAFTAGVLQAGGEPQPYASLATELDGARVQIRIDALGDVPLFDRVHLVLRVADIASAGDAKPGAGVGLEVLRRDRTRALVYLQYKLEGFSEPEGELEAVFAIGHQLGALHATANVAYGQDWEARERDAELALAAHVEPVRGMFAGVTARYRDALGTAVEPIRRDGFAGATGTVTYGRIGVTLMGGIAMAETVEARRYGPSATLVLGSVF
ncbi:MAG TPA: hypothetical protein VFQ53_36355 [Kofleriaceae bacterium]|nr:hypothetical protein [Kofleriaceae bacterium]